MLRMEQTHLAVMAGISLETVKRIELRPGPISSPDMAESLRSALVSAGIEFIAEENGAGPGVRLGGGRSALTGSIFSEQWEPRMSMRSDANILSWDCPVSGFCGLPVSDWRRALSSQFPDLYDRSIEQLERARKKAGVTQADLAALLGRPQSFVAKYEGRERRLDVAEYLAIARMLGVDPYRLLRAAERS